MNEEDKKIADVEMTSNSPDDYRQKKRFGYISALPSEHLIHFRKGNIQKKTSGQGASCFKRWRDTVFIIPTSLKEIIFISHQLTLDNVDVRIRGMAVYRISDPLRIYTMINFSNRNAAESKLAHMIGDMCRSTAKWLVSNMNLEHCLRKRKEEIADTLRKEVARVVADANSGWGVEIITIYIQDVFIHDDDIFKTMQMLFKSEKHRESEIAQIETRAILERKRLDTEKSLAEEKKQNEMEKARNEAEIEEEKIRLKIQNDGKQFELDRFRVEENEKIAAYKLNQRLERENQESVSQFEKAKLEAMAKKALAEQELEALRLRISVENGTNPRALQTKFIENLPQVMQNLSSNLKNVNMTIFPSEKEGNSPATFFINQAFQLLSSLTTKLEGKE